MNNLDIAVIVAYMIALIGLGFWISFTNRQKKSADLFLAGRSLGWQTIGLSIFGTNISPLNIISACGLAYSYGMVACNFQWFAWLYLLLLSVVFLPYYLRHDIQTMPQFMLRRYNESCRNVLSWIVFFQVSIGAGSVLYAGSLLTSQLLSLPVWQCVAIMTVISVSFTILGGLKAVVVTDSFQSIVMILVCSLIGVIALGQLPDWSVFSEKLSADYWQLLRSGDDPNYPWQAIIVGYPIMSIWYWCANQNIVQSTLGAKNLDEGKKGVLFLSYLKLLVPILFILPGIIARVVFPDMDKPDESFLAMVYQYLPHGLIGLAISVLTAALVSTVTAMFNSGSTIFTLDILPTFRKSQQPPSIGQGRLVIAGLALIASGIALALDQVQGFNLFEKINSIFSFLCPSLVAVFVWGVFWKRISSRAAFYTLIAGNIPCVLLSIGYLSQYPSKEFYPNFFLISFYLFVGLSVLLIILSYVFPDRDGRERPIFNWSEYNQQQQWLSPSLRWGWGVLTVIMVSLYVIFS
ncbi:SLC5 family protein [Larkinella bovis]|uniref:SLC5 family protein n=1 Tax=Larkinella bovis TaxID=683041 RepID=A0ABW0IBF8_9BACT